VHNNESLGI